MPYFTIPNQWSETPPFEPDLFTPQTESDRRRFQRIKCYVAVEIHVEGIEEPVWGNLANVGRGGCLVETASAVPAGKALEIGLWVASGKIWVKGVIISGVATRSAPSFGVRVKFSEAELSEKEHLREFLKFVESTARKSQAGQSLRRETEGLVQGWPLPNSPLNGSNFSPGSGSFLSEASHMRAISVRIPLRQPLLVSVTAALLMTGLTAPFALGRKKQKDSKTSGQMADSQRAVHALNRLTFGPRPGDVQRVAQIGVDQWIELQLHPEKIDDSALDARLTPFRTQRMDTKEIVENFPPNQVIKQIADGKADLPRDPVKRAVYEAQLQRYEDKQDRKQEAAKGDDNGAATDAAETKRRDERRSASLKAQELLDLPPAERISQILQMSPEDRRMIVSTAKGANADALTEGMNPQQKETVMALKNPEQVVVDELMQAKLVRAIYSERQLDEVMTDFWMNHFNVFINKGADRFLLTSYERDAIRHPCAGQVRRPARSNSQEPGHDVLPRQLVERRSEF